MHPFFLLFSPLQSHIVLFLFFVKIVKTANACVEEGSGRIKDLQLHYQVLSPGTHVLAIVLMVYSFLCMYYHFLKLEINIYFLDLFALPGSWHLIMFLFLFLYILCLCLFCFLFFIHCQLYVPPSLLYFVALHNVVVQVCLIFILLFYFPNFSNLPSNNIINVVLYT